MHRFLLAGLFLIFTGCREQPAPVRTARAFAKANRDGDCRTMWSLITADAQANIKKRTAWQGKSTPCVDFRARFNPRSARLVQLDDATALVSIAEDVPTGFLVPGFWATRVDHREWQLPLVREDQSWKVAWDRVRVPPGKPHP